MRDESQEEIRRCTEDGADHKEASNLDDVREIEYGAEQSSGNEAELHRQCQPLAGGLIEIPLPGNLRRERGNSKPKPHDKQHADGQQYHGPPSARIGLRP
ncbi:MAG: hypothetical protein ABI718_05880 [Acidobacteriota bacterium]